ncbi:hypothetical protein AB0J84_26260 [Micromonospora arborensis]|uniref:hypothetical protein n=1 Tax=Micromonospora arborensis TaxID=2116518 RepID=UPI0034238015
MLTAPRLSDPDGFTNLLASTSEADSLLHDAMFTREGSLFWLHWAGHGHLDEHGQRRLFLTNATATNLRNLNLDRLAALYRTQLAHKLGRKVFTIDACQTYADPRMRLPDGIPVPVGNTSPPGAPLEMLFASPRGRRAVHLTKLGGGVFTAALLGVLADEPDDRWPPDFTTLPQRIEEYILRLALNNPDAGRPIDVRYEDAQGRSAVTEIEPPTVLEPAEPDWQPLMVRAAVTWRDELDRNVTRRDPPALEVHLVPTADEPVRLSLLELERSAATLVGHARAAGLFPPDMPVLQSIDDVRCLVTGDTDGQVPGLAITRGGQRSAWRKLGRRSDLWVLDRSEVAAQTCDLLRLLTALPGRRSGRVVPAIGLEPAQLVAVLSDDPSPFGPRFPAHVRVPADDSLTWQWLVDATDGIGAELAARLVRRHAQEAGRR